MEQKLNLQTFKICGKKVSLTASVIKQRCVEWIKSCLHLFQILVLNA